MDRNAAILPGYALEDFLTAPEHTGWSADTRDRYRRSLQELYAYLQSAGPPGRDTLAAWQQHLQGQGYRPRSINTRISAANNYFRWCGRYDLAMRHSTPNEPETPQLTRSEYLRLLCTARRKGEHRLYLLTKLFATTGLPLQCLPQVTVQRVQAGGSTPLARGGVLYIPHSLQGELLAYTTTIDGYNVINTSEWEGLTGLPAGTIPQTGDDMPVGLLAGLAAVAGGGLAALLALRKRRSGK